MKTGNDEQRKEGSNIGTSLAHSVYPTGNNSTVCSSLITKLIIGSRLVCNYDQFVLRTSDQAIIRRANNFNKFFYLCSCIHIRLNARIQHDCCFYNYLR
jgi:hypothetical protein